MRTLLPIVTLVGCTPLQGAGSSPTGTATSVDDCDIPVSDVFPADGATGIFFHPAFDVPRVTTDEDVTLSIVADDTAWVSEFTFEDGVHTASVGLGIQAPPDTTMAFTATRDGCTTTLAEFTTGPWDDWDPVATYPPGRVIELVPLEEGNTFRQETFLGYSGVIERDGDDWQTWPLGEGAYNRTTCEPTVASAAGVANRVLSITGLNGPGVLRSGAIADWLDVRMRALVDPATGNWDRVEISGQLRVHGPVRDDFCHNGIGEPCTACPDTGEPYCIVLDGAQVRGEVAEVVWGEGNCP
jgi:hypothetical protein